MKSTLLLDIQDLVDRFNNKTLPKVEWTHQAHIIVAFWHNWNFDFPTAFKLVKSKIITYNEAVGTLNSDNTGYHETMTMFWMILTKNFLVEHNFNHLEEACNIFMGERNASRRTPLKYYSRGKLFSTNARHHWVNGDLQEIHLKT